MDMPEFENFVHGRKEIRNTVTLEIPIDDERTRDWLKLVVKTIEDTPDSRYDSVKDYCLELYRKLSDQKLVHFYFG